MIGPPTKGIEQSQGQRSRSDASIGRSIADERLGVCRSNQCAFWRWYKRIDAVVKAVEAGVLEAVGAEDGV